MKVLQINSVCGKGSTGKIATDIHAGLLEQGIESYIAYGRGEAKNIEKKYAIKIGNKLGILLHVFKTRVLDKHGYGSKKATKKLIKEIEKLQPDVIHLHNIHGYYINIEILFDFLKKYDKKVIWTLHDAWSITGHSSYFTYPKYEGWNNGIHECGGKRNYPKSYFIDRKNKNGIDKTRFFSKIKDLTIITPSIWLMELVKESHLGKYNIEVINNGIDTKKFRYISNNFKAKYNLIDKKVYLGVASIWEDRKGLKDFIQLSKYLKDNEVIFLVGLTRKQIKNLPSNVIGITLTNNIEELVEIYSGSDIFINPTLEDNYPTVNLEAAACNLPIITYNTGGSPESASFGEHIVLKENNVQSIINGINKINTNKNDRTNKKLIDYKTMVKKYINTYNN